LFSSSDNLMHRPLGRATWLVYSSFAFAGAQSLLFP